MKIKFFRKEAACIRLKFRQAERIKRDKAQAKSQKTRGDDARPELEPESLVAVGRFHGSRLASGPSPSPYQSKGDSSHSRPQKLARRSSGSTVGAAIVEAESSLEKDDVLDNKEELKTKLKEILREKSDAFNSDEPDEDKIKLGVPGWKERYYEEKFSANSPEELEEIRRDVVHKYTEGLCWVMHYYYEGVCSWQWFYPYHYAPFASDLKDLGELDISFELGSPFKPFNQLMGVFPAASSHALPEHYRKLMTDPNSPIIDFYPTDFEVDMNGKRFAWQGIAKLPFIDEARLLAEVKKVEHTLTEEEAQRNSTMFDMLFVALSHTLSPYIFSLSDRCKQLPAKERVEVKEQIDPLASGGMNGYISLCAGDPCPPIFSSPVHGMDDILDNQVICVLYTLPEYHSHISRPPAGVKLPKKTVTVDDVQPEPPLWHEDTGRKPWENGRNGQNNRNQNHNNNPRGAISGRHLGDAAHRLVTNSLQVKPERHNGHYPHGPPPPYPPYQSNRPYYSQDPSRMVQLQPSSGYPPQGYDPGYSQPYGSNTHYSRSNAQTHGYHHNQHGYVPPRGPLQHQHLPSSSQYYPQQGGRGYAYDAATSYHHQQTAGWAPHGSQGGGRGHARPQHGGGNQFSALSRDGGSRRSHQPHRR
ncbi:hypothetical protein M8C21_014045 [Ambrosia artemisiifolia]|uniref:Xrn1 helical domain-containing protein n=1 Tax=Ambrosia artemisiifolia TaxID=4212 RepID=A0AAD5GXN1_AMBAR|nr:hypothetical protein M8C21_014045 [Ambrosia artemisiifolia]